MINELSKIGGIFSILTFIHFFADFIFQSHNEAIAKHNNSFIRAKHCFVYSFFFLLFFVAINISAVKILICVNVLFWSHFIEDTYYPVYLWAKYIRKPPEMSEYNLHKKEYIQINKYIGFKDFVSTTLGKILMIAVDQIIHLAFLLPIAYLICR